MWNRIRFVAKWYQAHRSIREHAGTVTPIWIAVAVYVLVLIVRKQLAISAAPYTILQILSITLFEKTPILQAISAVEEETREPVRYEQLTFLNS